MTRDDVAALRASACAMVSTLGAILDSVEIIDQSLANPGDAFADGVITSQHLDEAAATADTLAEHANTFAVALDKLQVATREHVVALERGDR